MVTITELASMADTEATAHTQSMETIQAMVPTATSMAMRMTTL